MKKTELKPIQVSDLIKSAIDIAMNGNAGLSTINVRKAFGEGKSFDSEQLNRALIKIELEARKQMQDAINDFIELEPCKSFPMEYQHTRHGVDVIEHITVWASNEDDAVEFCHHTTGGQYAYVMNVK
jgi:hypothetical protein